ncbi:hypothetical protein V6N12_013980 [Hibiscus sabdariffa]|uniref:Uncharacterized protein n=1 Tax=Hibiscus sabdariffa TaxID=183260 RepID=A0ABR1ZJC4_9ROSI
MWYCTDEEILSFPSQSCGVIYCEIAFVDPTSLNRAQIIVHNRVGRKVRAMSDILSSFLSPSKRQNVFLHPEEHRVVAKRMKKRDRGRL